VGKIATRLALIFVIAATIGCDRVTKHLATATLAGTPPRSFLADSVRLDYVENTGGFLSLGATLPPALRTVLFTTCTGALLFVLAGAAIRLRWRGWSLFGVTLLVAGGSSNWADRLAHGGSVVDFLNIGLGPLRTGIFNVADVAIMLGMALLLLGQFQGEKGLIS
jgi:signal peptidase II